MSLDPAFSELLGRTLIAITGKVGSDEIVFYCDDGSVFKLYHIQDCGERVTVEDISGDLADLLDSPLRQAEEATSTAHPPGQVKTSDSFTYTFYRLTTMKGQVVIRWYGESNGYYSESVSFDEVNEGIDPLIKAMTLAKIRKDMKR